MRYRIILTVAALVVPLVGCFAQMGALGYIEYGYSISPYNSEQLKVFMTSYNDYYRPDQPFSMNIPAAKGDYFKFGLGVGAGVKGVFDFTIYKCKSSPLEARYANGTGRDVWYEIRNTTSNVGVRFGGTNNVPVWFQVNINSMIQHITIGSAYVFADGSRSLGYDHSLNGLYTDFNLIFGLGIGAGWKIAGPVAVSGTIDYIGRGIDSKSHPEYHQYDDNQDINTSDRYIPQDLTAWTNGAFATENSIYNDFHGFRFTFGIQLMLSGGGDE